MDNFEMLKLSNQLCFPLYACSKEVIKQYRPYLDKLGLTYAQCQTGHGGGYIPLSAPL